MKKIIAVLSLLFVLSCVSFAGICDSTVYDGANVLGGQSAQVEAAGQNLISQGADLHVITTPLAGASSLDSVIAKLGKTCSNWKSANGGIKANMLVIALAMPEHKLGIFTGSEYTQKFGSQLAVVKRNDMAPYFKGGDYASGFMAAERSLGNILKTALDESTKPVTNTTVNEASAPTDLHGLWVFLWILGALGLLGFALYVVIRMHRNQAEKQEAQQDAIAARNRVSDLLVDLGKQLLAFAGNFEGNPGAKTASDIVDYISEQFSKLAGTVSGDPTAEGLSAAAYTSLGNQFNRMEDRLERAAAFLKTPTQEAAVPSYAGSVPVSVADMKTEDESHPASVTYNTTYESDRSSGNDLATGILIGESLGSRREEPSYSEPEPERHADSGSSDDDDNSSSSSSGSWGGSSSSFGGDSDSSSSSFDSGSSSSFDSGSSGDSGGSFGGGSDSF